VGAQQHNWTVEFFNGNSNWSCGIVRRLRGGHEHRQGVRDLVWFARIPLADRIGEAVPSISVGTAKKQMNVFVFQSTPDRYDLRRELHPGMEDTWYATRYQNEMHPGDVVFFWMAGDEHFRGLYGWGHISSAPYLKAGWDSHGVDVKYDVKFARPILARSLRHDAVLADMLIFRAPQATNFFLSDQQAKRLLRLVRDHGERVPSVEEAQS